MQAHGLHIFSWVIDQTVAPLHAINEQIPKSAQMPLFTSGKHFEQKSLEIIVSFIERADTSGNGAAQKIDKRKNEPHPRNALFFAKLALVEGELLLTVSEEYFNIPAFCVDIENFQ